MEQNLLGQEVSEFTPLEVPQVITEGGSHLILIGGASPLLLYQNLFASVTAKNWDKLILKIKLAIGITMDYIRRFNQLSRKDVQVAGGKGAYLGEMTRAGFPIPVGFVVVRSAFDKFIKDTDLIIEINAQLKKVDPEKTHTIDDASKVIRQLINEYKMPKNLEREIITAFDEMGVKYVAVRSSATAEDSIVASWAGELESYLGIRREKLIKSIRQCWSSLFAPRAIFYRIKKGLGGSKVSVAVVVQKMIESEVAGVCFTVHPVTQDKNQMIIEASWGLGASVVAGKVTPDTYIVEKSKMTILDKNIAKQLTEITKIGGRIEERETPRGKAGQQCLSDKHIIELAQICRDIEKHYGFPSDIEWAVKKDKVYIIQSRPITTIDQNNF